MDKEHEYAKELERMTMFKNSYLEQLKLEQQKEMAKLTTSNHLAGMYSGTSSVTGIGGTVLSTSGTNWQDPYTLSFGDVGQAKANSPTVDMVITTLNTLLGTMSYKKRNAIREGVLAVIPSLKDEENFQIVHNLTTIITAFRSLPEYEGDDLTREHCILNTKVIMMAKEMNLTDRFDIYDLPSLKEVMGKYDRAAECFKMCSSDVHGDREIGVQLLLNMK